MLPAPTPRAVFIMGPTASGKTQLALTLAKHLPIEVISVDSALVYQGMDIGTAKPTRDEMAACPHHLISIISPEEAYSAARFCRDAETLIEAIQTRGRIPVLVGGTMLYFKALRDGLSELPQADTEVREAIALQARQEGWPAMHAVLATLDPAAAATLNPNDSQRIQRALEIIRLSGRSLAENYAQQKETVSRGDYLCCALLPVERSLLHARIATRLDQMLRDGLQDELRSLRQRYRLTADMPSMRCVGYRQMWEFLEGEASFDEMRLKAIAATRQLAKRQITWLRQFTKTWPGLISLDPQRDDPLPSVRDATQSWWHGRT